MSQQFRSPSPNTDYQRWQQPSHPSQPLQPPQSYPQQQWSQPLPPMSALPPSQTPQPPAARQPLYIPPKTPRRAPQDRRPSGNGRKGAIRLLLIGMALCVIVALASIIVFTRATSPQIPAPQAHATQPVGQSTRSANAPTQGTTSSTLQPTSQPTTQATAVSNPLSSSPVLGGDLSAFTAKYGQPNTHSVSASGLYHYKQYPGSNLDFLIVNTALADGSVYVKRVENITVQAPSAGWSKQEATTACAAFLPPDAAYKQQVNLTYGYDDIYSSALLAQLFPASSFVDVNGKQVQPGLFDVEYLYQQGTKTVASCSILIGTQQTQI